MSPSTIADLRQMVEKKLANNTTLSERGVNQFIEMAHFYGLGTVHDVHNKSLPPSDSELSGIFLAMKPDLAILEGDISKSQIDDLAHLTLLKRAGRLAGECKIATQSPADVIPEEIQLKFRLLLLTAWDKTVEGMQRTAAKESLPPRR